MKYFSFSDFHQRKTISTFRIEKLKLQCGAIWLEKFHGDFFMSVIHCNKTRIKIKIIDFSRYYSRVKSFTVGVTNVIIPKCLRYDCSINDSTENFNEKVHVL